MNEPPAYFVAPQHGYSAAREVVYRDKQWYLDNGNCSDSRTILYFEGFGPTSKAPCKPNEVDVPRVVGARLEDAKTRLLSMPLTPEIITRPARPGEKLGRVVEQFPGRGTSSSWDTVRIVPPSRPTAGSRTSSASASSSARLPGQSRYRRIRGGIHRRRGDRVIAQYPHAGLAATRNMTVRLIVGRA